MPTVLKMRKPQDDGRVAAGRLGVFVLPIFALTVLALLAIYYPAVSIWISDAAQAEFVGATGASISVVEARPTAPVLQAAK